MALAPSKCGQSKLRYAVSVKYTLDYKKSILKKEYKMKHDSFFVLVVHWNNILDTLGSIKYIIRTNVTCFLLNVTARKFKIIYICGLHISTRWHRPKPIMVVSFPYLVKDRGRCVPITPLWPMKMLGEGSAVRLLEGFFSSLFRWKLRQKETFLFLASILTSQGAAWHNGSHLGPWGQLA